MPRAMVAALVVAGILVGLPGTASGALVRGGVVEAKPLSVKVEVSVYKVIRGGEAVTKPPFGTLRGGDAVFVQVTARRLERPFVPGGQAQLRLVVSGTPRETSLAGLAISTAFRSQRLGRCTRVDHVVILCPVDRKIGTLRTSVRLRVDIPDGLRVRWLKFTGTVVTVADSDVQIRARPDSESVKLEHEIPHLAGQWVGQDGGRFTIRQQRGSPAVTWEACSADGGSTWQHDFTGTIVGLFANHLVGRFRDEPPGSYLAEGDLVLRIDDAATFVWVEQATIDGTTHTSFPILTRTWTRQPHAGCPNQGSGAGTFRITGVELPGSIVRGGPKGDLAVTWAGSPTFPITMVYEPDSCPQGFNCASVTSGFPSSANPLVAVGAVWCYGDFATPVVFDYSVYLRDASGKRTASANADFTCID